MSNPPGLRQQGLQPRSHSSHDDGLHDHSSHKRGSYGRDSPNAAMAAGIVIGMLAMVVIPAGLTLHTVRSPGTLTVGADPSPHGYTWSLLFFIVPILTIGGWFLPSEGLEIPQRAFWRTIGILVPLGCMLDFFFARWFFCFPNPKATLQILAPALGPWVPVEEYVFYFTGFVNVLLLYVWLSEYWLAAYSVRDYPSEARAARRLLQFHAESLVLAVGLIAIAWLYKKYFAAPADRDGFPGYFTFLVVGALVPAMSFYPIARRFMNWRAFSLTLFFMLLISLLWEATLALPYGWWNFRHRQMMGLFVGAWFNLPIEEVCVWMAVTYATTIVYEVMKVWLASARGAKEAFLGSPS
jgi:hypothetical protein